LTRIVRSIRRAEYSLAERFCSRTCFGLAAHKAEDNKGQQTHA